MGVKDALAEKTENKGAVKLTKSMSIADKYHYEINFLPEFGLKATYSD